MAVELIATIQRFQGRTSDVKPTMLADGVTALRVGCEFYEIDTGKTYVYDGTVWTQKFLPAAPDAPPSQVVATDVALDRIGQLLEALLLETQRLAGVVAAGFDLDLPELTELAEAV
jgi:hypothetical protein